MVRRQCRQHRWGQLQCLLRNPNALAVVSKGMQAVKRCTNKILQLLVAHQDEHPVCKNWPASARPYANNLHLKPARQPHQHPSLNFYRCTLFLVPTNSVKALKVWNSTSDSIVLRGWQPEQWRLALWPCLVVAEDSSLHAWCPAVNHTLLN